MCVLGMRTMSLVLGWAHLIIATTASILLLVLLCMFHSDTYEDESSNTDPYFGLAFKKVFLLMLFCLTDGVFALLLIKGIKEDRHRLMAPFVYSHYVALIFLLIITIIYLVSDLVESTFMELLVHFIANCAKFALILLLVWPANTLYHQMRLYPGHFESQWHSDCHPSDVSNEIPGEMV